jgi:metallo-beta-lactamase family protein
MKLTFWGASRQVTGSMYLLELEDDYKILIDCGLDMERKDVNAEDYLGLFPFEPSQINVLILTHAHLDHCGYIPNLLREGFEGKIICTHATLELTKLILEDAAALNVRKLKKIDTKRHKNPKSVPPFAKEWYLPKQVTEALELFYCVSFNQKTKLKKGASVTLIPAGHLLGAAHIYIEAEENGQTKRIGFSGDIGRFNAPLLTNPEPMPEVDYLVCESTYGNRKHKSNGKPEDEIYEIIRKTCVDIPGRLIVPAFSVGRTQALLYTLHRLQALGKLPPIKIFSDSPMALKSSYIYQKYIRSMNQEAQDFMQTKGSLFDFENLTFLETEKQSEAVSNYHEACVIISSSGMIQGGRIEHHVKQNLQNHYATILMIGFSAEGTLGYELMHGKETVKMGKKDIPVRANIQHIDVFSGHADVEGLSGFVHSQTPEKLKKIFLVHGDEQSMSDFQQVLIAEGYAQTLMPKRGESFEL